MTGPFTVRRRADEFDAALAHPNEPLTDRDARQFADLLALVCDLRSIPELQPRADFVADLRSRLMLEADTALLPQSARPLTAEELRISLPVRAHQRDRRLAALLGGAALVGATTSMALAAQTALPGESLYPVKRALEDARTSIARDDVAKGEAMLANAEGRLDEIDQLADRTSPASVSALETTLETFTDQAGEASAVLFAAYEASGDEGVIMDVRTFTSASLDRLSSLQAGLPAATRDELLAAAERLSDIDRKASQLCPSCGVAVSVPSNLLGSAALPQDVAAIIVSANQDPALTRPSRPARTDVEATGTPDPISGQDVDDVQVPVLTVPTTTATPTATTATPSPAPTATAPQVPGTGTSVKSDVQAPVNEVTKLLTGDLDEAAAGVPVTDDVVSGVGTAVDGTLAELEDALDAYPGTLLP